MTLSIEEPKYKTDKSLIGTNPGVGFRPQPDQDANVDSTLIWFQKSNPKETKFWSDQLKDYITGSERILNRSKLQSIHW
jgi:sodium/potassium-transporting ATPase subunit beta